MIKPTREAKRNLEKLKRHDKLYAKGLRNGLHDAGSTVVKEDRRLISEGPKTGRVYRIRGRRHQASAPGEPPANLSGNLQESADYRVHNEHKMEVGESANYARYLERGTSRIAPRPHLIKAVRNKEQESKQALIDGVKKEIC